jgi:hypothetical protein
MRIFRHITSSALIAAGLLLLLADADAVRHWGCHINDVATIDSQWGPIAWPTGEQPDWARIPVFAYTLAFWTTAALLLAPWPKWPSPYRARICRGTE